VFPTPGGLDAGKFHMLALTHTPSPRINDAERTFIGHETIDCDQAIRQHSGYCRMLERCGLKVRTLDVNRHLPDSVFIEDTAIVLDEVAVLASMGVESRRAEPAGIEPALREYRQVYHLEGGATLEGGDVLQVGRTLLVGLSSRTNLAGVRGLEAIVRRHGYRVIPVTIRQCLHLKSACTALPDGNLLVNPIWLDIPALVSFDFVPVPEEEPGAADILSIGGRVCIPAENVRTTEYIRQRGFEVETCELSEFAKADGGITCLSLLLND
jgi:dimethylargininase